MHRVKDLLSTHKSRATVVALLLFTLLITVACSAKTRQLFFDVTPPTAEQLAEQARREAELAASDMQDGSNGKADRAVDAKSLARGSADDDLPRPEAESLNTWQQVAELLPKDYKDDVDWSAALKQGLVRPRTGADPASQLASAFKYDFIIAAENTKNDAYFPHSAHTAWLGCENCHMTIFPNKRNPATMKEMRGGASCGTCHGSVAFSLKSCKRCHPNR